MSSSRPEFDREAIARKYAEERARRVVPGRAQVVDPRREEAFRKYLEDPFTPFVPRPPLDEEIDVAVVGAGIAGVVTGVRLREEGEFKVRLIDSAGGVGGTWYWNRYPGLMCDVESYVYLPMLEEMGYIPKNKYSYCDEILAYMESIAKKYRLDEDALFHTGVTRTEWDEKSGRWILRTDRGDVIRAKWLVMAVGILNLVKLPRIPGMERFKGRAFHSARWDYAYTGGSPSDPKLANLADKTVGVIGAGGSAIQIVPAMAASAKHLYVFQRTPSAIGVRANAPTPPEFAKQLKPGWQKERMENFTAIMIGKPVSTNLVNDAWTVHMAKVGNPRVEPGWTVQQVAQAAEEFDFEVMEEHRRRIEAIVKDPKTAEALKPYYRYLCKRPLFHDEYLPAFNRANVTLVDCAAGVEEVSERGLRANGREYELDCIVYATGFEAEMTPLTRRVAHDVVGRGGVTMAEAWKDGAQTLHGMMTRGFPNLFLSPAPGQQAVVSVNHTHVMVTGAEHIAETIRRLRDGQVKAADVSEAAQADWVRKIEAGHVDRSAFMVACTPSRLNFDNDASQANPRSGSYGGRFGDFFAWRDLITAWRRGGFPGLELEQK